MKIRKGDNVMMLSGKDRGKTGKVSIVLPARARPDCEQRSGRRAGGPKEDRIVVEGLNMVKRHVRARKQGQKGQIINKERAVPASSVALVCKACGKSTRIGYKFVGENKVRICKKCSAEN